MEEAEADDQVEEPRRWLEAGSLEVVALGVDRDAVASGQLLHALEGLGGMVPPLDVEAVLGEEHHITAGPAGQVERERQGRAARARR
jgi:hypothetical protein